MKKKGEDMSERGTFVTEYIYNDNAFNACKEVLCSKSVGIDNSVIVKNEKGFELPIIAGKIGGMFLGEEIVNFECDIIPEIQKLLEDEDSKIKIVVNAESRESAIFEFDKKNIKTKKFSFYELAEYDILKQEYEKLQEKYKQLVKDYNKNRKDFVATIKNINLKN